MLSDLEKELDEIRRLIFLQRKQLESYQKAWESLSLHPDQFIRNTSNSFARTFEYFEILLKYCETLHISNTVLKDELNLLRNIIEQLSEVNKNPNLLNNIEELFKKHRDKIDELFKKYNEDRKK